MSPERAEEKGAEAERSWKMRTEMGRREDGTSSRGQWGRERTKLGEGAGKGEGSRAGVSRLREQERGKAVQRSLLCSVKNICIWSPGGPQSPGDWMGRGRKHGCLQDMGPALETSAPFTEP